MMEAMRVALLAAAADDRCKVQPSIFLKILFLFILLLFSFFFFLFFFSPLPFLGRSA